MNNKSFVRKIRYLNEKESLNFKLLLKRYDELNEEDFDNLRFYNFEFVSNIIKNLKKRNIGFEKAVLKTKEPKRIVFEEIALVV